MIRLKNLLQYDASKFIFLVFSATLYILTQTSYLAIILLIAILFFLLKKSKNLLLYSLIFIIILTIRMDLVKNALEDDSIPTTGEVTDVYDGYFYLKSNRKYLVYFDKANQLKPGMIIKFNAFEYKTEERNIMHNFSYSLYLKTKYVTKVLTVHNVNIVDKKFNLNIVKYNLEKYIDKHFSLNERSYIKLFFLGDKSDMDKDILEMSGKLGISHLFAISGMHIALFVGFITAVLDRFYLQKSTHRKIIFMFLLFYNVITGFKITILRASLLIISVFSKDFLKILLTRTDLLSFSFIGFLIYNPYLVYDIGFELSYLLAFAIILGNSLIQNENYVKRIFLLSVYATFVSLPIVLELNKTYGILNVFCNVFFVMYTSILFLPMTFVVLLFPHTAFIYDKFVVFFNTSIHFVSENNIFININLTNGFYKLLYWILLFLVFRAIQQKKKVIETFMIFIASVLIFFTFNIPPATDFVRILDVNQGDSIHIHSQSCDMLIDTGEDDKYHSLENYFKGYEISKLDILLFTHLHTDHYGDAKNLLENMEVTNLYVNKPISFASKYKVLKTNDTFACGNFSFQVLNSDNQDANENNNSIVLFTNIGGDKWLFTGDIEKEIENKIVNNYQLDIDILKVPHHGSKTSSRTGFLSEISPEIAIISVGEINEYNLPDISVINRYISRNINLYRTDKSGTITFYYSIIPKVRIIETYRHNEKKKYRFQMM